MEIFDAEATRNALPMPALIEALRAMFRSACEVPPRHVHQVAAADGSAAGSVLVMPAWRAGQRLGIKTVNVFPGNTARGLPALHAVYTLFDATTGAPLAQIDGGEITARRTVAASALAASYLARGDAQRLLVVGAGRVAALVPEAMRSVRPSLTQVKVWNHRAAGAAALAARWRAHGIDAQPAEDLETAVREADIVSCATPARAALVQGEWLRPGAHLDLVGSFTPQMREADGECLRRCRVWVDTAEALAKSGDVLQAVGEGLFNVAATQGTLADLCRDDAPARRGDDELTLFKSVGTALEDLAAAELVFDRPRGTSGRP